MKINWPMPGSRSFQAGKSPAGPSSRSAAAKSFTGTARFSPLLAAASSRPGNTGRNHSDELGPKQAAGRVEPITCSDELAGQNFIGVHKMVTSAGDPAVGGKPSAGAGVQKSDGVVGVKLGGITRIARTDDGFPALIKRVSDAQARRDVVPRERRVVAAEHDTRDQVWKRFI